MPHKRPLRFWRAVLLAFAVFELAVFAATLWTTPLSGDSGFITRGSPAIVVTEVYGSNARQVHAGDVILQAQLNRDAAWAIAGYGRSGQHVTFSVVRDGRSVPIVLVLQQSARPNTPGAHLLLIVGLLNLFLGAAIAARGYLGLRTLLTAAFLVGTGGFGIDVGSSAPSYAGIALGVLTSLQYGLRYSTGSLLIWTFPGARRTIVWSAIAFTLAVLATTVSLAYIMPVVFPFQSQPLDNVLLGLPVATNLCFVLCWLLALASARNEDRPRLRIFTIAIVPWCLGVAAENIVQALPTYHSLPIYVEFVARFFELLLPLTLAYALFVRRVIDFGFALSRAAVFTIVSFIILGFFVLFEWLAGEWLHSANHTTNLMIGAAIALALGLSVNFVHGRVDRFVDAVLFRKRHADERAIQLFAREAPYLTDPAKLLERTVEILERHTDAEFVTLLIDDGLGRYGDVDENDPAVLRLRATHDLIDLHGLRSALRGELAFPMVARGRLVGAIVLGPRRSTEAYAPDERAEILRLAQSVGGAFDVLSLARREPSTHDLRASIDALRDAIAAMHVTIAAQTRNAQ